jgi:hypothetical protein
MVNTTPARAVVANQIEDNGANAISASDVRSAFYLTLDQLDRTDGGIASVIDANATAGNGSDDAVSAINAAMATGSYRFPAGVYRIASSITLTGTIIIMPGARLRPASGVTVTIAGHIMAGRHRIFDTSQGGVFVASPAYQTGTPTTEAYPEWWGATGTGVNCSPFIQAAINFLQGASGGTVHLNGWYRCEQTLFVSGRVGIQGAGPVYGTSLTDGGIEKTTTLDFTNAAANVGAFLVQNGSDTVNGFRLENLGIWRNPPEPKTGTSVGLSLVAVQHLMIVHCHIAGFAVGVQVNDNVNATTKAGYDGVFQNCTISGGRSAAIIGGCAGYSFHDCMLWSGEPNLDQIVLIGRGIGGMKADTLTFQDCRIQYLSPNFAARPQVLVRITDGMWINFIRTDIEEAAEAGILVQRDGTASYANVGLKTIDVNNCWFNGVGRCVVLSGFTAHARIQDCRMENASGGSSCIAIEFSASLEADIVIRGNNIVNSGGTAGIAVTNASGVRITENYIQGSGGGASVPGIILASNVSNSIVTSNRVRSNHAGPISNSGGNNTVTANIVTVI